MHTSATPRTTANRSIGYGVTTAAITALALALTSPAPAAADTPQTLCPVVGWVGDSTSINMLAEGAGDVTPGSQLAGTPLAKNLFATGVKTIHYDIASGRSAVEKVNGKPGAVDALAALPDADCYVAAIGTNDAGAIAAGSTVSATDRIGRLIAAAHNRPLLMLTIRILGTSTTQWFTPKAADSFNSAIYQTLPSNNIIDWARYATDSAFYSDGIHYTPSAGNQRSHLAAWTLAGQAAPQRLDAGS